MSGKSCLIKSHICHWRAASHQGTHHYIGGWGNFLTGQAFLPDIFIPDPYDAPPDGLVGTDTIYQTGFRINRFSVKDKEIKVKFSLSNPVTVKC